MSYVWYDLVGNLGGALIIVSYFLLQAGLIDASNIWYSTLNFVGAAAITLSLYYEFNLSAFIIEVFWMLISLMGMLRYYRSKRNRVKQRLLSFGDN